jgi:hypothetical protein
VDHRTSYVESRRQIFDLISYQHDGKGCATIAGKTSSVKVIQATDSLREVYFPLRRVATIRMTCS